MSNAGRSLSLARGSLSDCVSLPLTRLPGLRCRRDAVIRVINGAAPGRCAHHPGITPGGVICGDRDSPMVRGVRVAGPRVPASTLISHCRGSVRGSSCAATSTARFARQRFHHRVLPAMAPGSFSRRTASQRPGNSGPRTPVPPAATRYAPQHPLKRTGAPLGEPIWGQRETVAPARKTSQQDQGCREPPSAPGNAKGVSGAR